MNYRNIFKRTAGLVFLIVLAIFLFGPVPKTGADSLAQYRQQLAETQEKIDAQQKKISEIQKRTASLKNEIAKMDAEIQKTQLEINKKNQEIQFTQNEIKTLEKKIAQKEEEMAENQELMGIGMHLLYKEMDKSTVEIFLESESFSDFLNRTEYLDNMIKGLEEIIKKVEAIKLELESQKINQEQKEKKLAAIKAELLNKRRSITAQKNSKNNLLEQTQGQEAKYQKQLAVLRAVRDKTNSELRRAEDLARGGIDAPSAAGFYWPVRGRLTAPFGYSSAYFAGVFHSGIDIAALTGTPIVVSKDGVVIYTEDGWGNTYPRLYIYGNFVRISHENNFISVYAHLDKNSITVEKGDRVVGGRTTIGRLGNSGFSTGPHLHFEIRYNNSPVDPFRYLP